jgi:hypothetical protein
MSILHKELEVPANRMNENPYEKELDLDGINEIVYLAVGIQRSNSAVGIQFIIEGRNGSNDDRIRKHGWTKLDIPESIHLSKPFKIKIRAFNYDGFPRLCVIVIGYSKITLEEFNAQLDKLELQYKFG